jgi:hypothetical protein
MTTSSPRTSYGEAIKIRAIKNSTLTAIRGENLPELFRFSITHLLIGYC